MSEVSIREQIHCLEEMENYLKVYCNEMQDSIDNLNKSIKVLRSDELTTEFEEYYEQEYFRRTKTLIDQVHGDIIYGHLRYLDEVIEKLKSMLD